MWWATFHPLQRYVEKASSGCSVFCDCRFASGLKRRSSSPGECYRSSPEHGASLKLSRIEFAHAVSCAVVTFRVKHCGGVAEGGGGGQGVTFSLILEQCMSFWCSAHRHCRCFCRQGHVVWLLWTSLPLAASRSCVRC